MRRQRCGHPAAHQACHQAGVAGRGETLRTGSRARCRTRGQVVGHTISQTSVRLAPSSDLRGSRHDSVSYRIPMSELGVTGDDDACKCESNGASRVCVCMRHSRETGISLLVWSVFRRMCVWTVCAVGGRCARVFAAERQRCVYFRSDGAPVTIRSTGRGARPLAAAPGAVPGLGTMGRPFSATIQYNRVITDLSPGCRAVELSRIRRAAVEAAVEGLSRPCLSSLSSSCRVAVEPVEPDCMRDAPGRRGLSRSVELSSCRAMSSC